jgi:hypothetical protein
MKLFKISYFELDLQLLKAFDGSLKCILPIWSEPTVLRRL